MRYIFAVFFGIVISHISWEQFVIAMKYVIDIVGKVLA